MRTSSRWALRLQTRLQLLCACCAMWSAPATALAAPADGVVSERRVVAAIAILIAVGGVVGMIAGRDRGTRGPRLRLLNDSKKAQLSVLVPPGPPPRLIPSESPNAIRPRPPHAPTRRNTPEGKPTTGIVDYIAAFADPPDPSGKDRVDYLLVPDEGLEVEDEAGSTRSRDPS